MSESEDDMAEPVFTAETGPGDRPNGADPRPSRPGAEIPTAGGVGVPTREGEETAPGQPRHPETPGVLELGAQIRLRIAPRDVRANARLLPGAGRAGIDVLAARQEVPARFGALADAIRQRYGHRSGRSAALALALARPRPSLILRPLYQHNEVHLAPHLALRLATQWAPQAVAAGMGTGEGQDPQPAHPALETGRELRQIETFVQQLAVREVRVESVRFVEPASARARGGAPSPTVAAPPAVSGYQPAAPVPRITRRAAVAPAAPMDVVERTDEPELGRHEGRALSPWAPVPRAAAERPAVDINRLTDQVIQAIDRRVVAQRERRGRS